MPNNTLCIQSVTLHSLNSNSNAKYKSLKHWNIGYNSDYIVKTYIFSLPSSTKNCNPYSQLLRLLHLCSLKSGFEIRAKEMSRYFTRQGFDKSIVEEGFQRGTAIPRQYALELPRDPDDFNITTNDPPVLEITYYPNNAPINTIIKKTFISYS